MDTNNTQHYLNETYGLIKQSYAESRVFDDRVKENMDSIANVLETIARPAQDNSTETEVIRGLEKEN